MNARVGQLVVASLLVFVAGCGGGGSGSGNPPAGRTYTSTGGVAQKGPLILGSAITAQELSAALVPNGKQYSYQTNSDLGTFNPNSTFTSPYIGIIATGYYFDEVANALSSGPITLNAYGDLGASTALNVNLLTTLSYRRIETLVKAGATFSAAQAQAEREVLTGLEIRGAANDLHFGTLDLSKGTDGDKLLAAVSSVFVYGNNSANLAALIANFQSDLSTDGLIDAPAIRATLRASAQNLNPATVAANLNQKYAAQGVAYSAAGIGAWLDQDGDGLIGKFEYRVADATQNSTFSLPATVIAANVGATVSIANGVLTVNGAVASAPRQLAAGDIVSIAPPAGTFPDGVQTAYLTAGNARIARVSFVSGLASIAVSPDDASLPKGLNLTLLAMGTYTDGSTSDISGAVNWSSDAPAIASVAANSGLVSGGGLGAATISASSGAISGSTTLNVVAPILLSIAIEPAAVRVVVGRTTSVSAFGTYSDGTTMDVSSAVVWNVDSAPVATVTGGLITGVSLGNAVVTANKDLIAGSGSVAAVSNAWAPTASMSRARRAHSATLLNDGRVLIAGGGTNPLGLSDTAELYDPVTETWSPAASMHTGRYFHSAVKLTDGKVLVVGGVYYIDPALRSEIYDPATNSWTTVGPMLAARTQQTVTRLTDGRVLALGYSPDSAVNAEIFDPATNTWSAAAGMHHPRADLAATLLPNGTVLASGGSVPGIPAAAEPISEIYDPATNTWSDVGALTNAGWALRSVLLPNGKALAIGGTVSFPVSFDSAEIFDPATSVWTPAASMARKRRSHSATLLPNGKVLVTGGWYDIDPAYRIPEIYDPGLNSWSDAASMSSGRTEGTTTLLNNGKVLSVGGTDVLGSELLSTAELFDYAGNPY